MSDYSQQSAAPAYGAPAAQPAPAPASNPYGPARAATQSPFMAQPNDQRYYQAPPDMSQQVTRSDNTSWNEGQLANIQDQNADKTGAAQIGDSIQLSDGSTYTVTEQGQALNQQFHQSVEQHFGSGAFDAMVQFAGTLSQGEQASLERLVLSGDPASMQKAAQYVAQKMQASGQNAQSAAQYRPQHQPQYQQPQPAYPAPTEYHGGLSAQQFHSALTALEQSGFRPGQREYDSQYRALVQARSEGKRLGR